jgi:hypothetical protein
MKFKDTEEQYLFEERAAIMEIEGGVDRDRARLLAFRAIRNLKSMKEIRDEKLRALDKLIQK